MPTNVIPEDARQFILQHIDSIAQLEGLLMFRLDPRKEWDAETIANGLFISKTQATLLLASLLERGFIVAADSGIPLHYQYKPKSAEWANMVERLADLYKLYLVPITNLIHSKPKTRIQEFADAFRIRKD